jgi:hypothetical protein
MKITKIDQTKVNQGCNDAYNRYRGMPTPRDAEIQFAYELQGFTALAVNEMGMSLDQVRHKCNELFDLLEKTNASKH